jgi:hypothetical protein
MMIDISDVCHVGTKILDHCPNPTPCFVRINRPRSRLHPLEPSFLTFEIDMRHEMVIKLSAFSTRIRHGEQSSLVAVQTHESHRLEHVGFGAAEGKVIFIAI